MNAHAAARNTYLNADKGSQSKSYKVSHPSPRQRWVPRSDHPHVGVNELTRRQLAHDPPNTDRHTLLKGKQKV